MRTLALLGLSVAACAPVAGEAPSAPAPAGVSGALFVAGKFENRLAKVDLATGEQVVSVESCANPHELATSPDDRYVALACYGGTTVDIFRTSDLGLVASHDLGPNARPHGIVWHSNGHIYVTAEGQQAVHVLFNPHKGKSDVSLSFATGKRGSHMLAVSPAADAVWTTDLGSRTVTRVSLRGEGAPLSVEVGEEPEGIALSPDGKTLWVSARGSDKAFALDPQTMEIRQEVATGDFPLRIAIRPQGDFAVTSDLADGGLTVIDLASGKAVRSIAVSSREEAEAKTQVTILWSPDGKRIYVAETTANTIAEVDFATGRVLRRLPGEGGGDGMAVIQ
ncbi:beta-propeller fold lactonase family protein [Qipengyuania gaetbuli]|uniref:Vgb family protein n=1 Tax=Qipengyuania gaetbuli TaxID=266952 RepID=UPI001CD6BA86|nr:YncE family protein [Qipengyuania gaetbuli]MCA0911185.1 YncE family protein [Qipengyuania gaetbuli]